MLLLIASCIGSACLWLWPLAKGLPVVVSRGVRLTEIRYITVTIAPAFLCYTIYLCFGRIGIIFGTHVSLIPFQAFTIIFVTTDALWLILQAGGAAWSQADNIASSTLDKAITVPKAGWGCKLLAWASLSFCPSISLFVCSRDVVVGARVISQSGRNVLSRPW